MGELFYRFGISLLGIGVKIHSLFNTKSKKFVEGRRNLFEQLENRFSQVNQNVVWFHCASLGEFEQARPIIEAFKQQYPDYFILLTFFSPSGYEVRKNYEGADYVNYMPLDTASNAKLFVEITKPKIAFFIKYEFWHYHLKALSNSDCWVYSISAIFRANQRFFKFYGGFHRKILHHFDHIFVQNKKVESLLKGINLHNVTISGDTRFDRVYSISQNVKSIKLFDDFARNEKVLIGGSTWEEDIKVMAPFLKEYPDWKAIIAPHDISEKNLKLHEQLIGGSSERFTKIDGVIKTETKVIIIDNIGLLSSLYQYGTIAFIGGAYGDGLHNTLEAACFRMPIFFGDQNYMKFQEAVDLIRLKAAYPLKDSQEFISIFNSADFDLEKASNSALKYVDENIGATQIILNHIAPIIDKLEIAS
ncbi:3-deoxy-D-manno-octulosonic acid transferase [Marivirga arenosa]|uniref:3-deoxy-D-manno-octulosonic acid transferase n=1 Tax=Marivirga arenosa TaxID=3059076 RepID=A0AA51ZVK3_9BACT|nr:glycosyltransferase N-terminal domain-containing protein [Marivirga sp. BKB1-2]WNB17534.1 glycosyltransferase N-terminal domain-containing protein [Marivirga sp. BKB1-2]